MARKGLINFIAAFLCLFLCAKCFLPHQKSIWREPAFFLSDSHTEAERTHTKRMDVVKKKGGRGGIYKRGRNTWCRETEWNLLSPRLFSKDGSEKKTQLWAEIQIWRNGLRIEETERGCIDTRWWVGWRGGGGKQVGSACQIIHVSISENNLMYYWYAQILATPCLPPPLQRNIENYHTSLPSSSLHSISPPNLPSGVHKLLVSVVTPWPRYWPEACFVVLFFFSLFASLH